MFYIFTNIAITLIRLGHHLYGVYPIIIIMSAKETTAQFTKYQNSISYWDTVVHDPINPVF